MRRSQKKVLIFESEIVDRAAAAFPEVFERYATSALFAIRSIAQRINDNANEWLAPLGITASQYNHLVNLRFFEKGASLHTLSTHMHTTNAGVTSMINGLVAEGLVKRGHDPQDARVVLVTLTPKGRALIDKAIVVHHEHIASALQDVTLEERRTLLELLTKVANGFESFMSQGRASEPRARRTPPPARRPRAGEVFK
jgi:DNA-binding MarR family transcriptional regulator